MSNSKVSITLEINSGSSSKAINNLGNSLENAAGKAEKLAQSIGDVAGYQDVHIEVTKDEQQAIEKSIALQKKISQDVNRTSQKYQTLNRQTQAYKTVQLETTNVNKKAIYTNREEAKSVDELAEAEAKFEQNLKKVKEEAKDTKKALEYLKAARSGNYADAVKLQRQMDESVARSRELQQSVQRTNLLITGIFGSLVAGFSFRGIFEVSQGYIQLSNNLKLVANDGENVKDTLADLYKVANEAQQPVEATAEAFLTLKKNTQKLGLTQKDLLQLSSTLSKSIAIGGSSADAAKNSMIQFGQALSLGKLSGQNFNSVAEQTPGLVQAIANGLNMSAADLKNFANSGKLTTELIVQALQKANEETAETFSKLGNTINGSMNILKNRFSQLVGENDFFSDKASKSILLVANNLKLITGAVGLATLAVIGFKTQQFASYLKDMGETAKASSFKLSLVSNSVTKLGNAFTLATLKEKAFSVMTSASTIVVGGLTTAWKLFNTVVKASVIGAILGVAVWGVQKLVEGVEWLYEKWKNWQDEVDNGNKKVYKTTQEHLSALDVEITKKAKLIEQSKQELELLKAKVQFNSNGAIRVDGTESKIAQSKLRLDILQGELANLKAERDKVKKEKEAEDKVKQTSTNASSLSTGTIDSSADKNLQTYASNIANLKNQILSSELAYKKLSDTGVSTLSNLDQLTIKLKTNADGYRNLTKSQIEELKNLTTQLDVLKENASFTEQNNKLEAQNELLRYQLSLQGLTEEERNRSIESYKLEEEISRVTLGLSQEHAEQIAQQMRLSFELTQQIKKQQVDSKNSFLGMINSQIPTWSSFSSMMLNDIGKISDSFTDWITGGKVNFKEMTKSMIKDFLKLIVKATLLTGILEAGNAITGGGLSAALKTFSSFSKIFGFSKGGYTGDIPTHQVAGVVHGGEFVLNNKATSYYGRDLLEAMNNGKLSSNHFTTKNINNNQITTRANSFNVIINNNANVDVQQEQDSAGNTYVNILSRMQEISNEQAVKVFGLLSKGGY